MEKVVDEFLRVGVTGRVASSDCYERVVVERETRISNMSVSRAIVHKRRTAGRWKESGLG